MSRRTQARRAGTPEDSGEHQGRGRAFRGLALTFSLSFLNLVGLLLTVTALGGLGSWSRWQFVGAFGVIEAASGLANVASPNIWRLPVTQLRMGGRTKARLAASTLRLPHWGGLARCAAGLVCLGAAAWREGLALASAGVVPLVLALACTILAVSAALARAGVARPDIDVVQLVVRWRRRERESRPISIGAAVIQFLLGIATIPAVKLLPPSVLYQPELGPSTRTVLVVLALSALLVAIVYVLWRGRIQATAPAAQQRDAEKHA
jgi:hypothetical protein